MRHRGLTEKPTIQEIPDPAEPNPWRNGSAIHLAAGISVPEAKRIVRTLDDTGFDPEKAQLVPLPSRAMIARCRVEHRRMESAERNKMTEVQRPPRRVEPVRGPPKPRPDPHARPSATFERALLILFLLAMLGLQVVNLVRA